MFTQLYTTLQKQTRQHLYKTNYTKLYKTIKNKDLYKTFTKVYETIQNFTKQYTLYTTLHFYKKNLQKTYAT